MAFNEVWVPRLASLSIFQCSALLAKKQLSVQEKVPRDPGYTWLVIFTVDVAFFFLRKEMEYSCLCIC